MPSRRPTPRTRALATLAVTGTLLTSCAGTAAAPAADNAGVRTPHSRNATAPAAHTAPGTAPGTALTAAPGTGPGAARPATGTGAQTPLVTAAARRPIEHSTAEERPHRQADTRTGRRTDRQAVRRRGDQRPNVLMVTVDDAAPDNLRYMPNVRKLIGNRGVTMTNGVAPTAICVPARASLLTGQYAHNHGAHTISGPKGGFKAFNDRRTLPVWLRRGGYDTMFVGKYLNGYGDSPRTSRYVPPGWTEWRGTIGRGTYIYTRPVVNINGKIRSYRRYNSDLFSDYTVDLINAERRKRKPWFMMVNYVAPHNGGPRDPDDPMRHGSSFGTPDVAPRHQDDARRIRLPRTPNMFEADPSDKPRVSRTHRTWSKKRRGWLRENHQQRIESLYAVDEAVGRAVRALRRTGQLRNTVLMFSSDNGFLVGQHNRVAKPRPYEESQKIPMLMAGPGIPRNKKVHTQVTNPDLATTVAAIAGVRPLRRQDGVNVLPLLRGRTRDRVVPLQAWQVDDGTDVSYEGVRTRRWTYLRWGTDGPEELYDRRTDPYQLANKVDVGRYAVKLEQLRELTDRYLDCKGSSCSQPEL